MGPSGRGDTPAVVTFHPADDPARDSVDTLPPDSSGEGKHYPVTGNIFGPACQPCCEQVKDSNSPWVPQ